MTIRRSKDHPTDIFKRKDISLAAKGLYAILFLSNCADKNVEDLCSDEEDTIELALEELTVLGILNEEGI